MGLTQPPNFLWPQHSDFYPAAVNDQKRWTRRVLLHRNNACGSVAYVNWQLRIRWDVTNLHGPGTDKWSRRISSIAGTMLATWAQMSLRRSLIRVTSINCTLPRMPVQKSRIQSVAGSPALGLWMTLQLIQMHVGVYSWSRWGEAKIKAEADRGISCFCSPKGLIKMNCNVRKCGRG